MPPETEQQKSRRPLIIALAVILLLLSFLLFSQASLNLDFLQPEGLPQTLVFIALSALIFLVFLALTFVLVRNLVKLFAERKGGVLGSRFRTRMVIGALVLSFLPSIFLFLFSYVLMNRTIDKWFSRPVEELGEDTAAVARLLNDYAARNAQAEAAIFAASAALARPGGRDSKEIEEQLQRRSPSLHGGFALVEGGDGAPVEWNLPADFAAQRSLVARGERLVRIGNTDFVIASQSTPMGAKVTVGLPLPQEFSARLASIDQNQRRYLEQNQNRKAVRRFYMQLLLLITVLLMFASTWLSLFVARLVTRPVAALAEATQEISRGNLQYRVQVDAADELGELVASFNRMAAELEANRRQIEASGRELADKNVELSRANAATEQRRREIETILRNIPAGVLSLDPELRVTTSNRSFERMFSKRDLASGTRLPDLFEPAFLQDLEHLLRRADRMGTASRQMELHGLQTEVTAAALEHGSQRDGYVVVFEDLSELLKAQKQLAWREVARRVAHEIKNPLTPIVLSAERIRRHLDRGGTPDAASMAVIHGCVETISGAVETVRGLVDEFATLARFPAAKPEPTSINAIVDSALTMFNGRLGGIHVRTELARNLPQVLADPEGMKRVVANLVDNAAEAMRDTLVKDIHISTSLVREGRRQMVELSVADTGHGVTPELKERLFLPYFSTKERGTGLGLAIVSRIIEEHGGSVRVEENRPIGTRFVVELPVA